MRSFWSDPYLWVHLAGLAAVPIFLDFCLLGLAVGDPVLPVSAELGLVATVGIVPVLWMQWRSPFYIFSLLAIALRPTRLTDDQRRILRQLKTPLVKILTTLAAGILAALLWQLYQLAPIAAVNSPWNAESRWVGLAVAAIAFMGANLFSQVPASVVAVLMTSKRAFASVKPYPAEDVFKDFTVLGFPVRQVLPLPPSPIPDLSKPKADPKPDPASPSSAPDAAHLGSQEPERSQTSQVEVVDVEATAIIDAPASDDDQASERLDAILESELGDLSETLANALDETEADVQEPLDAAEERSPEGSDSSSLRQPPAYEDPEAL